MIKIFPFIFVLLWSSAFITTKQIIDNSDPFSALAFRFLFVAIGFYLFCLFTKQRILVNKKNLIESFLSGVLFHGFYLGGVFFFNFKRNAYRNCCFNSNSSTNTYKCFEWTNLK